MISVHAVVAFVVAAAPIDRDSARDAARDELSKRIYRGHQPGWFERIVMWIFARLGRALDRASGVMPGGGLGLLILVAVVVGLVVVLRLRLGPLRRKDLLTHAGASPALTADHYRAEAARFAAEGNWREALRARFRAGIRELEQRGVLDQRAGRTAGEIAAEAGAAMPSIAAPMRRAADVFNEVWYGDRPATQTAYGDMVALDEIVRGGKNAAAMAAR